ncbi:MAG: sugar transferase [Gaiellaceae bacterium]
MSLRNDVALDVAQTVEQYSLRDRALPRRPVPYDTALWVARAGRLAAIWLPIWLICSMTLPSQHAAFEASLVFTVVWKLALRHAYNDASVTVWTVGAAVPAALGAMLGLVLAMTLATWISALQIGEIALAETTVAVAVASWLWETIVAGSLAARRRVLVVGAEEGHRLVAEVSRARSLPFAVIGIVDDEPEFTWSPDGPLRGDVGDLATIVERQQPQLVVLADDRCRAEALEQLIDIGHLGFSIVGLPEFYEYAFGRLPVDMVPAHWFANILHLYRRPYSQVAKRAFDVVVASLGLVLVAPLLPLVALLVRRSSGPVIYRQRRLGEGGRPFTIYKFRTMRSDAEAAGRAIWAAERDPRVTRAGRFLRVTRLDELPQLWNVLRGEMSIVGPRPERPEFVAELQTQVPYWRRRHLVKPGVTGWAQVRRGYTSDSAGTRQKLSYDLWYLRHRSLVVDVAICARTVGTLLTGTGAR